MSKDKQLKYFKHTQNFYRFIVLKKIESQVQVPLPIESEDPEFLQALSQVQVQNLILEGFVEKVEKTNATVDLVLTEKGHQILRRHFIDFRLDLLKLEKTLENFYLDKIRKLQKQNIKKIALYGASDTAKSFSGYLLSHGFEIQCIMDDDSEKQGKFLLEFLIIAPHEITRYDVDAIVITSVEFQNQILNKLTESSGKQYNIIPLFD